MSENKVKYAMLIDLRKCVACHACTVACKSENNVPLGYFRNWVSEIEKGKFPDVSRSPLPRLCNHCENAPCEKVCPVKATYYTDDGTVQIDYDKCIGCGYCIQACPYDARFINPLRKTAEKCTYCYHRIAKGELPACVSTCIGDARVFGDINDPKSEISMIIAKNKVEVLKPEKNTHPKTFYIMPDEKLTRPDYSVIFGGEE
ncbi:4Fe-4S dicluster domain-containing protein [Cytobacillus sp. Hz8]|uniref:4Fe-4S dicluster domain-containing protein n=1 Tax=Cytobacillus sp. Hz8 TaxID=3347168 RepID=UPI0035DDC7C7